MAANPESSSKSQKGFKQDLEKDSTIIHSAIKKYGVEILLEDKTFDLVSAIVYRRIKSAIFESLENRTPYMNYGGGGGMSLSIISTISTILLCIVSGIMIYSFFSPTNGNSSGMNVVSNSEKKQDQQQGEGVEKKQQDEIAEKEYLMKMLKSNAGEDILISPFEFKTGKNIRFKNYFGKEKIFKEIFESITKYLSGIEKLTKEQLDELDAFNKVNFLLLGPVGTGKTAFVHHLATHIDDYLKKKFLADKHPEKYRNLCQRKESAKAILASVPSRIYFCEIAPGIINSKWHGESERNINRLFKYANILAERKHSAVFLFFDEGDVFFSKRNYESNSGELSSGLRSELLQRIGMRPTHRYLPVFVFCATNKFEVFDEGFKRRFANQQHFGLPSMEERGQFIRSLFADYDLTDREIDKIVQLTNGRSQSFICKTAKNYSILNDEYQIVGFKLREFLGYLQENRNNGGIV